MGAQEILREYERTGRLLSMDEVKHLERTRARIALLGGLVDRLEGHTPQ